MLRRLESKNPVSGGQAVRIVASLQPLYVADPQKA